MAREAGKGNGAIICFVFGPTQAFCRSAALAGIARPRVRGDRGSVREVSGPPASFNGLRPRRLAPIKDSFVRVSVQRAPTLLVT
jgi:hypothetical protein